MIVRRRARCGQAVVCERGSNSTLDEYGDKRLYSSILKPLELNVECGVDLVGRTVRPREVVQHTVPGGCNSFVHVTALRLRGDSPFNRLPI
jgi:hypothetical protein